MTDWQRAEALFATFIGKGAARVDAPVLLPAETLLDLYGEDIRNRAFVTSDALRGELFLRPDFTVPVVQAHMASGASPARYAYVGEVFRKQDQDPERPTTFLQVGYEVLGASDPQATDAEVFATIADALSELPVRATTGDIGILIAAVQGLQTTKERKAALMRHLWRPARFRALLERYAGLRDIPVHHQRLIDEEPRFVTPHLGRRTHQEVRARIETLRADAKQPPISAGEVDALQALLSVSDTLPSALKALRDIAAGFDALQAAVADMQRRADALDACGIAVDDLGFEGTFGRTRLEYYDGFVFGFFAMNDSDQQPVATGGRYDTLTSRIGGGAPVPAVGAVVRPGLLAELESQ